MSGVLAWLLDAIAPRRCLGCDTPGSAGWCAACDAPEQAPSPPTIRGVSVVVAGTYAGPLGNAVRRLKYASRSDLAEPLAGLLVSRARELSMGLSARPCWVPVPLHPKRLAERGFNQSALLAQALARATGDRARPRLLGRVRETDKQAALERERRLSNVRSAFIVRELPRAPIVLVDDVVTTGATLGACIDVLEHAGAHVAFAMAIAHAT